ncbi:hypothetical protein [Lentimicrobium sp.]|uniref:hypothetical protein n=1 Tax=Lentimicrobium sp. TaxID=2034841 RepID=UPI002B65AA55|nr:hypothetical protein [Lentimicrobium sp.]HPF64101.1 hypothetical protein [Lentimicrobium sp.]HPJ62851.1 hypothetical protein [Lentimicrobium sp.]HRW68746.1 hypothetical protein [Lentimicrobium sp.]
MRKSYYILMAILTWFILSSKSCGPEEEKIAGREKADLEQSRERIRTEFEADILSEQSLRAFEINAKQKIVDYGDYLGIAFNKNLDTALRAEAGRMIKSMFTSEDIASNRHMSLITTNRALNIKHIAGQHNVSGFQSISFKIEHVRITEPLRPAGESCYTGKLNFSCTTVTITEQDTVNLGKENLSALFYARKLPKAFGNDTLLMWSVLLGEIR